MNTFHRGQFVQITYGGETIEAMVMLASANSRSLMLGFKGVLYAHGGVYPGAMPVLMDDEGVYRDLVKNQPVQIQARTMQ